MVELDRWAHKLSGAQDETVVRKSSESFLTDRTPLNKWVNSGNIEQVIVKHLKT